MRIGWVSACVLGLFVVQGCDSGGLSDDEIAAYRQQLAEAEGIAEAYDTARREAIAALATGPLPAASGPCQVELPSMVGGYSVLAENYPAVTIEELGEHRGQSVLHFIDLIDDIPRGLEHGTIEGYRKAYIETPEAERNWAPDATLLVETRIEPTIVGNAFTPGILTGRLFIWDYQSQAIACVGVFRGTNSDSVSRLGQVTLADLQTDMYSHAVSVGISALSRVVPGGRPQQSEPTPAAVPAGSAPR